MSTQSIRHKDKCKLFDDAETIITRMSDKLILNRKYRLGSKPDLEDFKDLDLMSKILCEDNCRLDCEEETLKEALNILIIKYN